MGVISIVNGDYNPTNITGGAPPCRDKTWRKWYFYSDDEELKISGKLGEMDNFHPCNPKSCIKTITVSDVYGCKPFPRRAHMCHGQKMG